MSLLLSVCRLVAKRSVSCDISKPEPRCDRVQTKSGATRYYVFIQPKSLCLWKIVLSNKEKKKNAPDLPLLISASLAIIAKANAN